jgi:CHAD domain-containing protein
MMADTSKPNESDSSPPGRWITGLSAGMPLLDTLEIIFRQRYEGVLYYLPLAARRADENIEYVHKLRVACRRLGAVLEVLAEGFPEAPRQALLEQVVKVRRVCGRARDLDVRRMFLESLLRLASVDDAAVVELLCEHAVVKREREQREVRRTLEKLESRLRDAGNELLSSLRDVRRDAAADAATFGSTGCRILTKELAALWELSEQELDSPATLHQLRIACKHLRYAFEVFIPVLDVSFRDDFYPQLEAVQKLLGEIHDADEAKRAFRRTRKKWKAWRGTRKWSRRGLGGFRWRELRAGLDAVLLAYAQEADHARTEFLDLWPGFSGGSFRQPVAELLAAASTPLAMIVPKPGQGDMTADEHLLPN